MKKLLQLNQEKRVLMIMLLCILFGTYNVNATSAKVETSCPSATLILPELPTYLTCAEGAEFNSAPDASYDNGETGECENNGYIEATIVHYTDCLFLGIDVIYDGVDNFGNRLYSTWFINVITPAPPICIIPEVPDTLTCEEAIDFPPPVVTYSNGETGMCEISGTLSQTSYYWDFWDGCEGGYLWIMYDFLDRCYNYLPIEFTFMVEPAPAAEISMPTLPSTVSCDEAASFTAPDATFSNGLTGRCANNGTIPAQVIQMDGYVQVLYDGFDNCGNPLSAWHYIEIITPQPTIIEPDFPESLTVTEALTYYPPDVIYTNGLTGECGISGVIHPTDYYQYWDECNGGEVQFVYAEYLNWLNDVYFNAVRIPVIPDESCSSDEFCSLSQGAYGNPGGAYCNGQSQRELMDELLLVNGGMVLGVPGNGRSFSIPSTGGQCIEDILPGGGPSVTLTGDYGCGNFGPLLKNGRLKNSLLAQTITAQLNLWLSAGLSQLVLEDRHFITVSSDGCGGGSANGNSPMDDTLYFSIPSSVYNYLTNKTVGEIFMLANEALGTSPWPSNRPSLSAISDALSVINEAFDECRFIAFPDNLKSAPIAAMVDDEGIGLTIAPNPFNTETDITFSTKSDSKVQLEIYDLQGRLLRTLYEGSMKAGETRNLTYQVNKIESQSPTICIIRTATGFKHRLLVNMH